MVSIAISPIPPPVLGAEGAAERLELTGRPFVFFLDGAQEREAEAAGAGAFGR